MAAAKGLRDAKHFRELLNLILMLGNYMNGGGHNGGAFGFKIASINKVSDSFYFYFFFLCALMPC